ncbi:MAG: hypothetical protein K0R08_1874 [Solimicrobium sp.]|nr:hypothetical protein [Solimicrobium sp.]
MDMNRSISMSLPTPRTQETSSEAQQIKEDNKDLIIALFLWRNRAENKEEADQIYTLIKICIVKKSRSYASRIFQQ